MGVIWTSDPGFLALKASVVALSPAPTSVPINAILRVLLAPPPAAGAAVPAPAAPDEPGVPVPPQAASTAAPPPIAAMRRKPRRETDRPLSLDIWFLPFTSPEECRHWRH